MSLLVVKVLQAVLEVPQEFIRVRELLHGVAGQQIAPREQRQHG